MHNHFPLVPRINLENLTVRGPNSSDSQLLSLDETTLDSLRTPELMTEDRICNRAELDSHNLFQLIFCVICQEVVLPQAKTPVFCVMCKSAVYCKQCITQWQTRSKQCCYCKQSKPQG